MPYPIEKHCQNSLGHFIKIIWYILPNVNVVVALSLDLDDGIVYLATEMNRTKQTFLAAASSKMGMKKTVARYKI